MVPSGSCSYLPGPLSIIPARRAGLVLIILEGVAVVAMPILALAVLALVLQGYGPQGDPPLRDLLIPTAGVGTSAIAMGLRSACCRLPASSRWRRSARK